jgi:hypothetical protein
VPKSRNGEWALRCLEAIDCRIITFCSLLTERTGELLTNRFCGSFSNLSDSHGPGSLCAT